MADFKVDWRKQDVIATIKGATDEALTAMVAEIEALTKLQIQANGQIDTGFMLNSIGFTPAQDGVASAHVAAEYAVFQEIKNPFLYPSLQTVAGRAMAIMGAVYRDRVGD